MPSPRARRREPSIDLRHDLALALRAAAQHGLSEGVCNHFSVALQDDTRRFLINPRGLHWSEIGATTAPDTAAMIAAAAARPAAAALTIEDGPAAATSPPA